MSEMKPSEAAASEWTRLTDEFCDCPDTPHRIRLCRIDCQWCVGRAFDAFAERVADERVMRALTVLVHDEIISAARAREIAGMSADEQRAFWREENSYVQGQKIETHLDKARAEEREACAEIVRKAVYRKEWHRSVGYALGKVAFAIRSRG